ncbi:MULTISPECIES: DUF3280 domain-containing protein [Methylobacterium]|uniref:DUF2380 domain-containing protein n=2 Tax=Pseudomonadota TaxID=1224 RepID=A0ABQ4T220_9HYPH|nr:MULTISPECIES: DUF3280 domain-containing protein [Methylobacterium]PIU07808.1 MAG: hypothetical protein COT56_03380 [Methylobacterium sp. CG09_land_8_20_14_0_10_71_15]PIU13199.1 MAG: hypothetical protein COT28_12225 [Methylobacterium sp. CG08_land_8_20_14_0_20_71_15]GBU15965.1 hypothetical protein AwMethylo_01800 [Methylobacterium sp.]GJE08064.1 hypothetical protein AOPFMNJM_3398 [Methylobacterium jeotgali]
MVRVKTGSVAAAALLAALSAIQPAQAGPGKAAVFPVELLDPGIVGGRKARPDEQRRLGLVTEELKKALTAAGVETLDTAPQAAEVARQGPLYKCECAGAIGKSLGADLAVNGYVEKGSNQIFNLYVFVTDAGSGARVRAGQVVIRADTDDTWAHAMRWVVKNRLLAEPLPNRG